MNRGTAQGAAAFFVLLIISVQLLVPLVAFAEPPDVGGGQPPETVDHYWYGRALEVAREHYLGDVFVRQMMQESGFQDDVIYGQRDSWAGARGIAQIMPDLHPNVDPLQPDQALGYAARFMLDLLVYFNGSVSKALAAYNGGAGNVMDSVTAGGPDWLQLMPAESQQYVQSIMLPGESDTLPNWPAVENWWLTISEGMKPSFTRLYSGG